MASLGERAKWRQLISAKPRVTFSIGFTRLYDLQFLMEIKISVKENITLALRDFWSFIPCTRVCFVVNKMSWLPPVLISFEWYLLPSVSFVFLLSAGRFSALSGMLADRGYPLKI